MCVEQKEEDWNETVTISSQKIDREPINSEVSRRNDKHFTAGYEWLGICGRYQLWFFFYQSLVAITVTLCRRLFVKGMSIRMISLNNEGSIKIWLDQVRFRLKS